MKTTAHFKQEISEKINEMKDKNGWEIIDTYTRKEALADGVQFQIPDEVRMEAGINYPVFVTQKVWQKYLLPPPELPEQDLEGRIWDLLTMFRYEAKKSKTHTIFFDTLFQMPDKGNWEKNELFVGKDKILRIVRLEAVVGPQDFDDYTPAITIMQPHED